MKIDKKEVFNMNKKWRKFRLQTNEEKIQKSIKSIIDSVNEQSLKNLSVEELENFHTEVKKIIK